MSIGQFVARAGLVAQGQRAQENRVISQRAAELEIQRANREAAFRTSGGMGAGYDPTTALAANMPGITPPIEVPQYVDIGISPEDLRSPVISELAAESTAPVEPTEPAAPTTPTGPVISEFGRPEGQSRVGTLLRGLDAQRRANMIAMRFGQSLTGTPNDLPGTGLLSRGYGYFSDTPEEERQRAYAVTAQNWYSSTAADIFKSVPGAWDEADRDPVAFYEKYKDFGKTEAAPAQPTTPAAPTTPTQPADPTAMPQLPANQARRYESLASRMGAQLQNPDTQALLQRAQQLGVDPAAALAVYALENNYGGTATSGAGARGTMQVTKPAYEDVRRIFPTQAEQLGLPAKYEDATLEQLQDAGLLYIAALQQHYKIQPHLIGAAYHAGPRKEIREGQVPSTYDKAAGISTADHNAMYVGLYNQANQLLGGQLVLPQPTFMRTAGISEPGEAPSMLSRPITERLGRSYVEDPTRLSGDMQLALQQRNMLAQIAQQQRSFGSLDSYWETQVKLLALDQRMYYMHGMQGIQELSLAGDPRRLSAVWSFYAGMPVEIRPRTDGTYNILLNGQTTYEGATEQQVTSQAMLAFSEEARQRLQAASSTRAEKEMEFEFWTREQSIKFFADIQKLLVEGKTKEVQEMAKQAGVTFFNAQDGTTYAQRRDYMGNITLYDVRSGVPIPGTDMISGASAVPTIGLNIPMGR